MSMTRLNIWKNDLNILSKGLIKQIGKKFSNLIYKVKNFSKSHPLLAKKHAYTVNIDTSLAPDFFYQNQLINSASQITRSTEILYSYLSKSNN